MSEFKAGFARVDVTPNLGYPLEGYYQKRNAEGILDNLYATAVAFDDGNKKAVIISLDAIGMQQARSDIARKAVAEKVGIDEKAVYIACTHTHLGLGFRYETPASHSKEASQLFEKTVNETILKICDAAMLAINDLKPAQMSYNTGTVDRVTFCRRFKMIDGSFCTNPNLYISSIVEPEIESDKTVQHLIIKREDGFDIGIVNFQVHADNIGGSLVSADFPHFVRDTYEKILDNTKCMFICGTCGDTNCFDKEVPLDHPVKKSYLKAKYMGRKIAMAAIANYELATPLNSGKISYGQKNIIVDLNKGTPEEEEFALKVRDIQNNEGYDAARNFVSEHTGIPHDGEYGWTLPSKSETRRLLRIAGLADGPSHKELYLTAVAIGDVVFAGFPGEPFTEVGRQIKNNSKFTLTIPSGCTNGFEGYFPTKIAFEHGGYEAETAKYKYGTAEKLIEASTELVNSL